MYKYEKMYEDCCLRFHGVAVNSPRKMEKNGETEIGYFICWTYFPLGFEREREKRERERERERELGMSGNRVNLGGNVGDFLWIPDEKKDVKNDCVKGNVGILYQKKKKKECGNWEEWED
ncbi:hypothetical protein CFP56_027644 [Quercus suber]|uniref:Uncharacterized protein n=1 Tax=Quercus suber TaxID=58331 RepID=A0AAW0JVY5_QUESU